MTDHSHRKPQAADLVIPAMLVGFFLVVVAVNIVFVTVANRTHSGVVRDDAYARGVAYNQIIDAAERQAELGWALTAEVTSAGHLVVRAQDNSGAALQGATISAQLKRPAHSGHDFQTSLVEADTGTYQSDMTWPMAGQWDMYVEVAWRQQSYMWQTRLMVSPDQTTR